MSEPAVTPPAAPPAAPDAGAPPAAPPPPAPAGDATPPKAPPEGTKETLLGKDEKPEGEKGADAAKSGDDIQITLPKGVELDDAMMTSFKGLAKEMGLDSAKAQKMADLYFANLQGAAAKGEASREAQVLQWAEEAKADKDIGGPNFDANLKIAQQAIRQFGSPELAKLLNETGLGNRKELIGLFAKIGKAVSEDRMPKGAVGAGDVKSEDVPLEKLLYPSMNLPTT